jgi:hypothetical protein
VELKPNVPLGVRRLIEHIELFEDKRTADLIEELVDEFLEDITSCDPFVQPDGDGDRNVDTPEFQFDVHSLEVKVTVGYPWGKWSDMLEELRLDWLSSPYSWGKYDRKIVSDITDVQKAVEEDGSIPEGDRWQEVWDRLPDHIQIAVDEGISKQEWQLGAQNDIRESLIDSISEFVRDTVDEWDQELRSFKPTEIVFIDRESWKVCGRGMEVASAVRDLTQGAGHPDLREADPSDVGHGRAILTAYRVPEGIDFDPEDADLVQRWGESEGSYSIAVTEAA